MFLRTADAELFISANGTVARSAIYRDMDNACLFQADRRTRSNQVTGGYSRRPCTTAAVGSSPTRTMSSTTPFLPKTSIRPLQITLTLLSSVFVFLGLALGTRLTFTTVALGVALIALGVQLWRLNSVARSVAKFLVGATIVMGLGTVFNPFFASDYQAAHDGKLPDWATMAVVAAPLVLVGLFMFWMLDRHKAEFRKRSALVTSPSSASGRQ